jgi:cell division protein YceG involved in septum cleavage
MNYQRAQIHQKKLSAQIKASIGLGIVVIFGFFWISWTGWTPVNLEKTLVIPKGAALANLDTLLEAEVSHTRFKLWKMFFAPDIVLKSGIFAVPEGTNTLEEVFIMLENPTPTEEEITLLPGWHKGEIAEAFKKNNIEGDLLQEEKNLITALTPKYPFLAGKTSLEGFLMPDTYRITGGTDLETMVSKMLDNFQLRIYDPFLASGKPVEAFYDVLILASIVGEEEKSSTQLPIVADILKKRLRQGWHIGADITVCYADLIPGNECQKYVNNHYSLSREARDAKNNIYDTRTKIGLPPTPIASISKEAFMATLNATAETPAWYYLHDSGGVIRTATSEAEHEANKAKYLR